MNDHASHHATIRAAIPCPFCGNANVMIESETNDKDVAYYHRVVCLACGAEVTGDKTIAGAISKWNRRAHLDTLAAGQEWVPVEHEFSLGTLTTWDDGIEDGDGVSDWWIRINELAAPLYDVRLCQRQEPTTGEQATLPTGQAWTPVDLELYEYPDGKTGLVYTSSDGYGRAQLRYLQDADTDTPKETIIILPEHLRLCQREPRPATGEATA